MASLKSFLYGVAPTLGTTGAALYERQRILTTLGVLGAVSGRGPGSGVPLTAENFAAVLISLLATDNLSEVDQRVVDLCNSPPFPTSVSLWKAQGKPTFKTEVGRALSQHTLATVVAPDAKPEVTRICVQRPSIGEIIYRYKITDPRSSYFKRRGGDRAGPIEITADIGLSVLNKLQEVIRFALTVQEDEE